MKKKQAMTKALPWRTSAKLFDLVNNAKAFGYFEESATGPSVDEAEKALVCAHVALETLLLRLHRDSAELASRKREDPTRRYVSQEPKV